jgi:hypothetical protein
MQAPISIADRRRLARQRQRQRQREARVAAAIAAAERQEIADEKIAPAVVRHPVVDGSGRVLTGARVVVIDGRPQPAQFGIGVDPDPLVALARKSRQILPAHIAAAQQLRADWRLVGSGLGFGASDYLRSGGRGDGYGRHRAMMAQIEARARLDGALAYIGAFAPMVSTVVLDCVPLSAWARAAGKSPADAIAWIVAALTRLSAYYAPDARAHRQPRILTFAPPRTAYVTGIVDTGVSDVVGAPSQSGH